MNGPQNHYDFLGLDMSASREAIVAAVEQLHKQAIAIATVSPERSQQLRERIRTIRQDLLTTNEHRNAYDQSVLREVEGGETFDTPLTAHRDESSQPQSPPRAIPIPAMEGSKSPSRMPRSLWLLALVVPLTVLITIGLMRGLPVFGKQAAPTVTSTPSPTTTPTPKPTVAPTSAPLPTATTSVPAPANAPPTALPIDPSQQAVINAVDAYNSARKLRFGPTYDDSQVAGTMTGVAQAAITCLVDNNGKNLQDIHAYLGVTNESHGPQTIAISGSSATLQEYKSDTQTEYYADGTTDVTPESFTVTYTLTNDGSGWKVSDYAWTTANGGSGNAAQDAAQCQ